MAAVAREFAAAVTRRVVPGRRSTRPAPRDCWVRPCRGGRRAGWSITELCRMLERVGRECASTAMILAMHHSRSLVPDRRADTEYLRDFHPPGGHRGSAAGLGDRRGGRRRRRPLVGGSAVRPAGDGRVHLRKTCP
ncbi:hypothetical protein QJS66_11415 [Kocuria rhizophila]|nr:hypothetical protein QJS66_11415 [Kocuria rhizophila]